MVPVDAYHKYDFSDMNDLQSIGDGSPTSSQLEHNRKVDKLRNLNKICWNKDFYQTNLKDIEDLVEKIQTKFGYGCLVFKTEYLNQEQRCALWSFCNIYLNTSLKQGVCLQAMEYVCVKKTQNKLDKSVCIISEFIGLNKLLGGAIRTNPYDIDNISNRIDEAITMSSTEKEQRMIQSYDYISVKSISKWVQNFLV